MKYTAERNLAKQIMAWQVYKTAREWSNADMERGARSLIQMHVINHTLADTAKSLLRVLNTPRGMDRLFKESDLRDLEMARSLGKEMFRARLKHPTIPSHRKGVLS